MSDEKFLSGIQSQSLKFNEKSYEKKNSQKILESFEGNKGSASYDNNQLKKFAITKNILRRFQESNVPIEGAIPKMKLPFEFNGQSGPKINSFYKRTTFINSSFNKDESGSLRLALEDSLNLASKDQSPARPGSISDQVNTSLGSNGLIGGSPTLQDKLPEEIPTAYINEFFAERLTLSQKIQKLNNREYNFTPSFTRHVKI